MGLFDKNVRRSGRGLFSSTEDNKYDIEKVNKQIENARTRIEDAGYTQKDADRRNWFEKATNLPQGQNAFFDVLELLGRPGSAVVNAVNTGIKGGDALQGAWRGFSGQDRTRGADLAETLGVENKFGKFALGTGLDIALDPTTYIPGAVFAKGASLAGKGIAGTGRAALGAAERVAPEFTQNAIRPALEGTRDALGRMFVPDYKLGETLTGEADDTIKNLKQKTENDIRFQTEESMKRIADTATLAGGIDKGTDVGRILEKDLRQFEDAKGYEFPDGVRRTTEKQELLDEILANRNTIKELGKELQTFKRESPAPATKQADQQAAKNVEETSVPKVNEADALSDDELKKILKQSGSTDAEIEKLFKPKQPASAADNIPVEDISRALTRTAQGEYKQLISQTVQELEKTDKVIRKQYFSRENAALRQLNARKNKPLDIDELAQSKAFGQVSVSPAFNYLLKQRDELKTRLDTLRLEEKQAKSSTIDQIKQLKTRNDELKESLRNPVMMQKEAVRTEREISTDPAVQQAAQSLMESNNEIRQMAADNGIGIKELEGYMTHVLSAEERKRRKNVKAVPMDRGNSGLGQPNKNVVKGRELMGSVEDINERIGRNFFEPNAFFATAIGQKKLIDYANAANFRRQVLSNTNFARKFESGMDVSKNAVVIDTNNYKFINDEAAKELGLAEEIGGQYLVTKSVKQALDRYQKLTSDEGVNAFLKAFDTAQSGWKRLALFSVPYHLRNDVGAKFNNWVGGMSIPNIAKYTAQADKDVYNAVIKGQEVPMFKEFREQGLGSTGLSAVEYAKRGEEPEEAIRRTIEKRSQFDGTLGGRLKAEAKSLKNPLNAFETSRDFGDFIDQTNRFALYKWARDKGMNPEQAAKKVREVQFDYSRTTPFESEVAARIAPFYRWVRNNIPFQLKQFVNDPRKYANINKLRTNAQEAVGINEENVPDWMKESFAIPVTGEDGKGKFLGLGLPIGDLTKVSDPLKMLIDSTSSLVKLPAELSLNRNFFYDKPIEKFEGQEKQFQVPFGGPDFGVDAKTAYVLEQLLGQPGRGLSGYLQKPEEVDQDTKFRMPTMGISSMLKPFDAEQSQYYQQRDELQNLLDLISYIEQQTGERPRSVQEIQKGVAR
ncbi:hypothetical protein [Paenibacillus contaminans]|uniref:Large polyvalent protein associated domain-containing protein n=1 Tax=Paenibacillus contaminans TaxID=450362 RepID=A0A329MQI4_9BACL|nr:hypothetical protein [Paenibacillus contaminans]RAV22199.1 hypothetical protein DQG23_04405 [Paenibacillus contaminans]